jgi:hypothetical protein
MYITTAITNNMEGGRMTPKKNRSTRRMSVPVPFCQPQTSSALAQPCLVCLLFFMHDTQAYSKVHLLNSEKPKHVDSSCVASNSSSANKTHHRYWCSLSAEREERRSDRTLKQSVQWEFRNLYFISHMYLRNCSALVVTSNPLWRQMHFVPLRSQNRGSLRVVEQEVVRMSQSNQWPAAQNTNNSNRTHKNSHSNKIPGEWQELFHCQGHGRSRESTTVDKVAVTHVRKYWSAKRMSERIFIRCDIWAFH